jgi:hypothetical protein
MILKTSFTSLSGVLGKQMENGTIYDGSSYQAWRGGMNVEHEFGGVVEHSHSYNTVCRGRNIGQGLDSIFDSYC